MIRCTGRLVEKRRVARDTLLLGLEGKELALSIEPGQFVMLGPLGAGHDPFLCRPFSVHRVVGDRLYLLVAIVGKGTARLAGMQEGSRIHLLGPCGRGFSPPDGVRDALLVAGGIGVAPLAYLAERLAGMGTSVTLLYGTKSAELQVELDWLEACGVKVERCTDDGSMGQTGTVLSLAEKSLGAGAPAAFEVQYLAACGPEVMLRRLWRMVASLAVPRVEFALENRMACGVGACLGCTIELASGKRARVCREGPVFDGREVYGP